MAEAGSVGILELRGVVKRYAALQPLRVDALVVRPGERVALGGLDTVAAEMLVALVLGAALPDEGEVRLFGRPTSAIHDEADWLAALDRVGLVSPRGALIEIFTVLQNLALPWTLDLDPLAPETADKAAALAHEVGIAAVHHAARVSEIGADVRLRVQLGRALALDPSLLVLEHPTAGLSPRAAKAFAADVAAVARARGLAVLALTADDSVARLVAERRLAIDLNSGRLTRR
jgi:ABC-type transporter Mla maintaining outer membrane lipid asymmetry ATPase subunit MlaF